MACLETTTVNALYSLVDPDHELDSGADLSFPSCYSQLADGVHNQMADLKRGHRDRERSGPDWLTSGKGG